MPPQAILFDLGDTLLRGDRLHFDAAIGALIGDNLSAVLPRLTREVRDLYDEIRRTHRAGVAEFPIRGFLQLVRGLAGQQLAQDIETVELDFWKALCQMHPLPHVAAVLAELRSRGMLMAVVSNSVFSSHVLRYELNRNGLLEGMSFVISSADYGIQKPHPQIFRAALAQLGIDAADVWFVGDNFEKDIVGASQVGMKAVWLGGKTNRELPIGAMRIGGWNEFLVLLE